MIYILSIFFMTYFIFVSSNTDNPLFLGYSSTSKVYVLIPQGWSFFTRNPREDVLKIYRVEKDTLLYINSTVSLSLKDLFGIKRHKKRITAELSEVMFNVKRTQWHEFRKIAIGDAAKEIATSDTIANNFKEPLLKKGVYVIYTCKRLPWAWAKSDVSLPYQLKKVYIQ